MYTLHLNSDAGYAVLPLTLLGAPVNMVTERDGHASARDRDSDLLPVNTHTHTPHTAHRLTPSHTPFNLYSYSETTNTPNYTKTQRQSVISHAAAAACPGPDTDCSSHVPHQQCLPRLRHTCAGHQLMLHFPAQQGERVRSPCSAPSPAPSWSSSAAG